MQQNYLSLKTSLETRIPSDRLLTDPLHTLAYGTDASFYRLIPQVVVKVVDEDEVEFVLREANRLKTPVTFRAGGTSLSGQAVSDSVLVMLEGNSWKKREVLNDGHEICLQPGVIGAQANVVLHPFNRKIGPDPASIGSAKIGGIAANNASGMCCGTAQNSYNTLRGMRVLLADGACLDTRDETSVAAFRKSHVELLGRLEGLAAQVKENSELEQKIRHKFRLKNTTGYALNALVDYSDPVDILQHLMIGSEGTLGFISEINYETVHDHPQKTTTLVFFPDVETACKAVHALQPAPVTAVELIDRAGLHSVESKQGMPEILASLPESAAALLVDVREHDEASLELSVFEVKKTLAQFTLLEDAVFTDNAVDYQKLWNVRKGLFPAVGAMRETGTTVIIEDVAFPLEYLAEGTLKLQALFKKYHYHEALIFGHALAGNLHFVFTQDFSTQEEVDRYADFMHEVAELVAVEYGGSLKAEHGTGRNMAPYVEMEWGKDAYLLMKQLKDIFDPENLLNPGVILNDDPHAHIKNLKPLPAAHPLVDRCIECGFCESICPSRDLTLTPRQRITSLREISRLGRLSGADAQADYQSELEKLFNYDAIDTCAADGLCATLCPVEINTGDLIRDLRREQRGSMAKKTAQWVDGHMAGVTAATRVSLKAVGVAQSVIGDKALESVTAGIRKLSGERIPLWHRDMPGSVSGKPASLVGGKNGKVVYFPSCASRSMGTTKQAGDQRDLFAVVDSLLGKAGFSSVVPETVDGLCCGLPFASKGLPDTANDSVKRLEEALWAASEEGALPVLCDTSPCTMRMIENFTRPLEIYEPTGFIHKYLMPHLTQTTEVPSIALHVTCSSRKMGLAKVMEDLARACAADVIVPEEEGCCGFAGDKGFNVPELNASALKNLKQQVSGKCKSGVSNSLTCEIGLSHHSGVQYQSIAYLVDRCFSGSTSG